MDRDLRYCIGAFACLLRECADLQDEPAEMLNLLPMPNGIINQQAGTLRRVRKRGEPSSARPRCLYWVGSGYGRSNQRSYPWTNG